MDTQSLQAELTAKALEHNVPGVAVGVFVDGVEHYAFHGVTSVENPLEVTAETLFQFGSTGKTFTATAMMRLVEQGLVSLDDPVRLHVPELKLQDESVAAEVTIRQLFNHTAGWDGDFHQDTGLGDDALTKYVELMAGLRQVTPLGASVSYNNASLSLAGRVIEKVTGKTFEQAIRDLLLDPLELDMTFFFTDEIMTRRFVVGHAYKDDTQTIARPWGLPRNGAPAGGLSANARDQIKWAKFHLGDGTTADGTRLLTRESLDLMKTPTVECAGNALGDAIGISWLLAQVDGVTVVKHGGTMIGQYSDFMTIPEKNFAVISMSNSGPGGPLLNHQICEWAMEHFVGVRSIKPVPVLLPSEELEAYAGRFETIAAFIVLEPEDGRLRARVEYKPETFEMLRAAGEDPDAEQPAMFLCIQEGNRDRYVGEGDAAAMVGYFDRDEAGAIVGVNLGGRYATRVPVTV